MRTKYIGTAGSGKTRIILDKIVSLTDDPHEVSFASLTNAARDEITERVSRHYGVTVDSLTSAHWRTTHSTAIRGVGVDGASLIFPGTAQFSRFVKNLSVYAGVEDALKLWDLARMAGEPFAAVAMRARRAMPTLPKPYEMMAVVRKYEALKRADGVYDVIDPMMRFAGVRMDVSGAIEHVRPYGEVPDDIRVLVLDEAQDASFLVHAVQRRLEVESRPEHVILAADPYQSIYSFLGGTPRFFLDWEVDETITMERSWRCAPPIYELGQRCLSTTAGYKDYGIRPADHAGAVHAAMHPAAALEACGDGTVMLLARTRHRAEQLADELGVPAAPIGTDGVTREARAARVFHDLQRGLIVPAADFAVAADVFPASQFFERGVKARWKRGEFMLDEVIPWRLREAGVSEVGEGHIKSGDWGRASENAKVQAWKTACDVVGPEEATLPRVRYGTVHASKGLEADSVIVDTVLPPAILRGMVDNRDEERRVSYVGVTRARRNCVILRPSRHNRSEGVASWIR